MLEADPREALSALANRDGISLAQLSTVLLQRGPAYLQQYVRYGSPRTLAERDRRILADHFGVSESVLGGEAAPDPLFRFARLDVAASAGPGRVNDGAALLGEAGIPVQLARQLGLKPGQAHLIRVAGSSMEPTLFDGDEIVVDTASPPPGPAGGIYVVRWGDTVMVKRVARYAGSLRVTSDNPDAGPVPDGRPTLIGRAVWSMRRL